MRGKFLSHACEISHASEIPRARVRVKFSMSVKFLMRVKFLVCASESFHACEIPMRVWCGIRAKNRNF